MRMPPESDAGATIKTTPLRVILASQSPRRRDLLTLVGIVHEVAPADVDESVHPEEAPALYTERLARAKAHAIAVSDTEALVIGSDTTVVIDGDILGKPEDAADAIRMVRLLSGRTHQVVTAVAVCYRGQMVSGVEQVSVTFRPLTERAISAYVATGEPMDKAGGYGIQGFGATIVERIDGDFFSVMGLPLGMLVALCQSLNVNYNFGELSVANRASR